MKFHELREGMAGWPVADAQRFESLLDAMSRGVLEEAYSKTVAKRRAYLATAPGCRRARSAHEGKT